MYIAVSTTASRIPRISSYCKLPDHGGRFSDQGNVGVPRECPLHAYFEMSVHSSLAT